MGRTRRERLLVAAALAVFCLLTILPLAIGPPAFTRPDRTWLSVVAVAWLTYAAGTAGYFRRSDRVVQARGRTPQTRPFMLSAAFGVAALFGTFPCYLFGAAKWTLWAALLLSWILLAVATTDDREFRQGPLSTR